MNTYMNENGIDRSHASYRQKKPSNLNVIILLFRRPDVNRILKRFVSFWHVI